jgi:MFS family permease
MNNSLSLAAAGQRITGALFASQSLFSAATIASFTLTPIIAVQLAGGEEAAGVPVTLTWLGRAAVAYPIGWLMDRLGRRNGLSIGYFIGTIGMGLSVMAIMQASYLWFLLGALLVGAARASAEQSRFVAAEAQPSAQRARAMGLIVFAGTIGAIGGPLLVAPSEHWAASFGLVGATGPFIAATVMLLLGLIVTLIFLRPDPLTVGRQISQDEEAAIPVAERVPRAARPLREIFGHFNVQLAVTAMVIGQLVMTLLMVITPVHMDHLHHPTTAVSGVIMAHTLGMFGLSGLTGWLLDRYGRLPIILAGTVILITSALLTPGAVSVPMLAVALFLLGLGWNFCFLAGSAMLAEALRSAERGRAQGVNEMFVAVASGGGSLTTGAIFVQGGITAVSVVSLALMIALGMMALWGFFLNKKLPAVP